MTTRDSEPLTRDLAPFGVRMPPALKERVHAAAKLNNRSMNAEIVATLEEKYPAPPMSLNDIIIMLVEMLREAPVSEHQRIADEGSARFREANLPYELRPEIGHDGRPVLKFVPKQD